MQLWFMLCQARNGRTVVLTIHQPRANMFLQFDSIMLLAAGRVAYFGPPQAAVGHFSSLGYQCPALTNPADFLLDLLCPIPSDNGANVCVFGDYATTVCLSVGPIG